MFHFICERKCHGSPFLGIVPKYWGMVPTYWGIAYEFLMRLEACQNLLREIRVDINYFEISIKIYGDFTLKLTAKDIR